MEYFLKPRKGKNNNQELAETNTIRRKNQHEPSKKRP
jgi:hypothetical protein